MPTVFAGIKYFTNIDDLRRELKAGTGELVVLHQAADRTVRVLGGEGLIRSAHNAAAAIDKLGGVSALTAKEAERVHGQMGRVIEKMEALNRAATAAGQQTQTIPAAFRQLYDETKRVEPPVSRINTLFGDLGKQLVGTAAGFISAQAIIGGVRMGIHALTGFVKDSVQAFSEQQVALSKMTTALRAQGQATPEVITQYKRMASQFQETTAFSDELINEMQALLVQVGNVMPRDMEKALRAATNLSAGLGVDLRTATMLVGKAFEGETGTLKRYGIVIDEAKLKTEGITAVLDAIQQKFGGQAQAELDTYAGKVKQLANAWGELKETIGEVIVTDPLLNAALKAAKDGLVGTSREAETGKRSLLEWWIALTGGTNSTYYNLWLLQAQEILRTRAQVASQVTAMRAQALSMAPDITTPSRPNQFGIDPVDTKRLMREWTEAAKAAESYRQRVEALADQLSGRKLQGDVRVLADALRSVQDGGALSAAQFKAFSNAAEELRRKGAVLPPVLAAIASQSELVAAAQRKAAQVATESTDALTKLMRQSVDHRAAQGQLNQAFREGVSAVNAYVTAMKSGVGLAPFEKMDPSWMVGKPAIPAAPGPTALQTIFGTGQQFGQMLTGSILSAIQGGGNVAQAAGASIGGNVFGGLAKSLTTKVGDTAAKVSGWMGGALNAALPVIGSLIGQFGGKLIGKLIDIFGKGEQKRVNDLRDQFLLMFGPGGLGPESGFHTLARQLHALGAAGDQLFQRLINARKVDDFNKAMADVKQALGQAAARTAEFNEKLATSLQRVKDLGGGIPDALKPYLDKLKDAKQLTADNLALLEELAAGGTVDWRKLEEAAGRYGASTDKLGKAFNEAKLHEAWQQIIDDIDLFERGQVDVNGLLGDMADEISKLVQTSLQFGTAIPANMRPWIEKLIAAGQLLDASGDKITDIGKLTFGETLQTSLEKLVKEIQRLIETLGGVPAAIDAIPNEVNVGVTYRETNRPSFGMAQPEAQAWLDNRPAVDVEPFFSPMAGGGLVRRGVQYLASGHGTDTVPAMLTPGEGVLSLRGMAMLGALNRGIDLSPTFGFGQGAGAHLQATVILEVDRRELARANVPVIPGEARRLGVRVRN